MNDNENFSEIEEQLRKLRPKQPSAGLIDRIERALNVPEEESGKIIRPEPWRFARAAWGLGLAAAAIILIFVRLNLTNDLRPSPGVASSTPAASANKQTFPSAKFLPAGATQVVYNTRDEGLVFPKNSEEPVRRLRTRARESLQWRNPTTGASLQVSFPTEQVRLIPVSGQ